ncbi:MAG: ABC transporter ATP-binding protein [Pseudomonadota bacterium]
MTAQTTAPILSVTDLRVGFRQGGTVTQAVKGVSFAVHRGETLALVGESGSGKSVSALSTVQLLGDTAEVSGSVTYDGREMIDASEETLRQVRGNDISFIFQEPMTSLNPLHTIEKQLGESLALHRGLKRRTFWQRMTERLIGLRPVPVLATLAIVLTFVFAYAGFARTAPDEPSWAYMGEYLTTVLPGRIAVAAIYALGITALLWAASTAARAMLRDWSKASTNRAEVLALLEKVGIRDAESRLTSYPHQLSGGQRQRVMIAMALANGPDVLIADEPTTALDVTIQAQILELLADLKTSENMGMLFITHDLAIVRRFADRVCVMQNGEIVEHGPVDQIFDAPQHPYTQKLLGAEPDGAPAPVPAQAEVVAETDGLKVWFPITQGFLRRTVGHVKAVNGADLTVRQGETVGIVGESGSGKTTLALAIMQLIASEGRAVFMGQDLSKFSTKQLRRLRADMQIVFQDPYGSLSPRMTAAQIIAEGLSIHEVDPDRDERELVAEVMTEVGLNPDTMDRYPHEFSGGQRQRIAIARAMVLRPRLVVLDEPTSALDMTVQVQIVDLLRGLQAKYGLAFLFISHDLNVVRAMSHKVLVMKNGDVVEQGDVADIFDRPQEDYTRTLVQAAG